MTRLYHAALLAVGLALLVFCDELRALPRGFADLAAEQPHGYQYLYEDRHELPRAWRLALVTVVVGPWKFGGEGPGDRVPCEEDDPQHYYPETDRGPALGYAQVWSECPALDRMLAGRSS